jgi:formylglycine-generating enzyme required for sulfatase activity
MTGPRCETRAKRDALIRAQRIVRTANRANTVRIAPQTDSSGWKRTSPSRFSHGRTSVGFVWGERATPFEPAALSPDRERALKPKDVVKECDNCPEMVVVPAGSSTMGSPQGETGRDDDEGPQRTVTIGKPFAVGKFHVTVDQFAAFVAETGYDAGSKCGYLALSLRARSVVPTIFSPGKRSRGPWRRDGREELGTLSGLRGAAKV